MASAALDELVDGLEPVLEPEPEPPLLTPDPVPGLDTLPVQVYLP